MIWPSRSIAPPVDVLISRPTPCACAALSTLIVPSTLVRASLAGSATDLRTSIWAARWKITSGPVRSTAAETACASRTSSSISSAPFDRAWSRFSRLPVEMSSITATSSPRATSASTRFEPMKPAPPVTRVFIRRRRLARVRRRGPCYGRPRMRGLFVTFEGIDRSGKTTQARLLADALGAEALGVREPGGTPAGERVRELLKDAAVPLGGEAEALLFAAARAELVARVIRPALEDGRVVVSDRFLDSSLAYQGGARGLGLEEVERINRFATGGLVPDLTFLLEIEPSAASARAGEHDRFEGEGTRLQEAVLEAYGRLAAADPGRWRRIDATRPPDEVHADVLAELDGVRA